MIMRYNPNIHHRRSIRLKGYDYSQAGLYFVTICVQNKDCLFGEIIDGKMILNNAGNMIEKWGLELSHKFSDILLDTYVIMPNHFHAIIINNGNNNPTTVGADLRVCPDKLRVCPNKLNKHCENVLDEHIMLGAHIGAPLHDEYVLDGHRENTLGEHVILGEHAGSPLHAVVQWFKTMTTNEYIRGVKTFDWQPFDKKLWQRNYWKHIIGNAQSYQLIAEYIINNPAEWENDDLNTK